MTQFFFHLKDYDSATPAYVCCKPSFTSSQMSLRQAKANKSAHKDSHPKTQTFIDYTYSILHLSPMLTKLTAKGLLMSKSEENMAVPITNHQGTWVENRSDTPPSGQVQENVVLPPGATVRVPALDQDHSPCSKVTPHVPQSCAHRRKALTTFPTCFTTLATTWSNHSCINRPRLLNDCSCHLIKK